MNIPARRENATHSTGPQSDAGKQRSSKNAFRHGLASFQAVVQGESQEEFEALQSDLMQEHQPSTVTETLLIRQMALHFWLSQRAIRLQTNRLNRSEYLHVDIPVLIRYQATNERAFHKDLDTLLKLQKERKKAEIGSVSQGQTGVSPRPSAAIHPVPIIQEPAPTIPGEPRLELQT